MENAVVFEDVYKSYPSYDKVSGGIKNFLFHLPKALDELIKRRTVLQDLSFEIRKGETFGFIGRNGAGKSTTLGLIAQVLKPEKGRITVKGRVSPLLQLGAGFHPELSGRENIRLNGVLLGLTLEEIKRKEEEIIDFSELADFIHQPVRTYSSGMTARLGFSVIAMLNPEILIVDEVLAVGDIAFSKKCEKKFTEFSDNPDVTIIMVSHVLNSVKNLCDRAAWIDKGRLKAIGAATDVVKWYREENEADKYNKSCFYLPESLN